MSQTDEKYLARLRARYHQASKKERSAMLDEYAKTTGHNRKYAIGILRGKRKQGKRPIRRRRRALYGDEEARALLSLWELFDGICSKRLRAALDVELPRLYEKGFLQVSAECNKKLMKVSPATIDRLLAPRRLRVTKSRGFTKPGTLLKGRIPIRTWADWNEDRPGFCEMDLVDHCGGRVIRGADHAWTLCFTDVNTAWTECVACATKLKCMCLPPSRMPVGVCPFHYWVSILITAPRYLLNKSGESPV